MNIKGKLLLIPASVLLLAGCGSDKNTDISGNNDVVNNTDNPVHFNTKKDAFDYGNKVTAEICEEGMILLKNENNALPLRKNAKVSVFGKNSVDLVYGGSGSAAPSSNVTKTTILESLTAAGFEVNKKLLDFYSSSSSGEGRHDSPILEDYTSVFPVLENGETPISSYPSDVIESYSQYSDAALVVFSRIGGENFDSPRVASDDSNRHYLELDNNERALLKHIVDSGKFSHVVILLNGSNYIDLGFLKNGLDGVPANKIDACINIGSPGANGITALGKILNGQVNPSGRTVDLVYTNYKNDPTWQNFGGNFDESMDYYYSPNGIDKTDYHMVEYEENIYMGYRYYETRGKDNESWYQENVVYPFGYGLSYTTFSAEVLNKSQFENKSLKAEKFTVDVKVTNTGNVDGKQVIQVYAEAPYINGGIEKPYKVLAGFGKTGLLGKGKSEVIKIEINPYYFASFDNHDKNGDGFKGFTLDSGDYKFHVATDSHSDIDVFTMNLAATFNYDKDPITNTEVKPLFDDVTDGMKSNLSRTDWNGTFPTTPSVAERTLDTALRRKLSSTESNNYVSYDDREMPTMDVIGDEIITIQDLRGVDYDNVKWDAFLDQLSFRDMLNLFNKGCYSTANIEKEINGDRVTIVPSTISYDGPTGIVPFLGNIVPGSSPAIYDCCYYCSECLVAQTYNLELAAKQAEAIGEEARIGNEKGDGLGYAGWYAPRVNLHRSPFSGRNTECYSEDPFLTGKFAATVIDGVQKKGVYANVKNFALNDQETHRSANGLATWVDEQAMRELYFRPFEITVKEGKSRGLMTSFNRIGTTWTGGDYRLLTKILREEWGFVGSVISDFYTDSYMDSKQMLYAGGDLNLTGLQQVYLKEGNGDANVSSTNKKDVFLLRNASHNLLYCVANSNGIKIK